MVLVLIIIKSRVVEAMTLLAYALDVILVIEVAAAAAHGRDVLAKFRALPRSLLLMATLTLISRRHLLLLLPAIHALSWYAHLLLVLDHLGRRHHHLRVDELITFSLVFG